MHSWHMNRAGRKDVYPEFAIRIYFALSDSFLMITFGNEMLRMLIIMES